MSAYQVGERVTIHRPGWRDATGRRYPAGARNGQQGTIVEVTAITVGACRLYVVQLAEGAWPHWGRELWPAAVREEPPR